MKNDKDRLCPFCDAFDYYMNRKDGVSLDFYVECNHTEEEVEKMLKKKPNYMTEEQINGEFLKFRPWHSVHDLLPGDKRCVEFASHQHYGLANYSPEKGFHEVFLTCGTYEDAEYYKDCNEWNDEIMWWRNIPDWPNYGKRGIKK